MQISLSPFINSSICKIAKLGFFYTFEISNNHSFISQVLKVVDPFSVPWDLTFKEILITKRNKFNSTQFNLIRRGGGARADALFSSIGLKNFADKIK